MQRSQTKRGDTRNPFRRDHRGAPVDAQDDGQLLAMSSRGHCCKVSDEAAFVLFKGLYVSKLAYCAHFACVDIIKC